LILAYANHGRWVAGCPRCNSAEHLRERERYFRCQLCGFNDRLRWPRNHKQIEAALAPRPTPNRNWYPGETVGELIAENIEHGIIPHG
jgi:hypothetical protein